MMKIVAASAIGFATVGCLDVGNAIAQTRGNSVDGNKLHEWTSLNKEERPIAAGIAMGYVMGVHDAEREKGHFCLPARVTNEQMVDVVKNFLAQHPQSRHKDADVLVSVALANAWPCPKPTLKPQGALTPEEGKGIADAVQEEVGREERLKGQ